MVSPVFAVGSEGAVGTSSVCRMFEFFAVVWSWFSSACHCITLWGGMHQVLMSPRLCHGASLKGGDLNEGVWGLPQLLRPSLYLTI